MCDCFRNLDEEFKIFTGPFMPVGQRLGTRSPVKSGIYFDRIKLRSVKVELFFGRKFFRKEKAFPVPVRKS